jgi:hypothetical protein
MKKNILYLFKPICIITFPQKLKIKKLHTKNFEKRKNSSKQHLLHFDISIISLNFK